MPRREENKMKRYFMKDVIWESQNGPIPPGYKVSR
jgi:hypothetical protein